MKKLMIASLGLSLLTGTAMFAQNTSAGSDTSTMKKKGKKKKSKSSEGSTTSGSTSTSK
jgi:hypothetical protein